MHYTQEFLLKKIDDLSYDWVTMFHAITKIKELHQSLGENEDMVCRHCLAPYPCQTIRSLNDV